MSTLWWLLRWPTHPLYVIQWWLDIQYSKSIYISSMKEQPEYALSRLNWLKIRVACSHPWECTLKGIFSNFMVIRILTSLRLNKSGNDLYFLHLLICSKLSNYSNVYFRQWNFMSDIHFRREREISLLNWSYHKKLSYTAAWNQNRTKSFHI